MQPLGNLPGASSSMALDLSGDGAVVVGESPALGPSPRAFPWTEPTGLVLLRPQLISKGAVGLEGWTLQRAAAISPDGAWIVGAGRNPSGQTEAWLARMPRDCPGPGGDANSDGLVNFFDIDPFIRALFDFPAYAAEFCSGERCAVDVTCDGEVNFFDIDAFLACLFATCPPCA